MSEHEVEAVLATLFAWMGTPGRIEAVAPRCGEDCWRPEDFRLSAQRQPTFTSTQADDIRRLLRAWASDPLSRPQTAGE